MAGVSSNMERKKSKKEILTEEIDYLLEMIEKARIDRKDCSKFRKRLIELIIELDLLTPEKE